jgi:hypothetical protein
VWLTILSGLAVIGAFFMLIIPGIWLSVALAFRYFTFLIEGRRGTDALRESRDYIKGYWWAVLGRSILLGLALIVVTIVLQIPLGIIFGPLGSSIGQLIMTTFTLPFGMVFLYKMYENLRTMKPELEKVQTKEGRGFIKAAAIVGIFGSIILFVFFVWVLITFHGVPGQSGSGLYMYPQYNNIYGNQP